MEKKKVKLFSAIALVALALLVVGATYAYFQNQYGSASNADVNVTTYTTDMLTFETGDAINISADQATFAQGKGNRTGSTFARATLQANNKTNTATANYYVYLNISNNLFTYSINESTPELILTVTNSAGTEVTDISGLTHTSVTDGSGATISGYDITNKSGLITLFNNREITASPSKEETWNIKLTFVNYNKDQNGNAGKSMSAKVMIQKEMLPLHESCNDNTLACHVAKLYTGTKGENNIYYHDSSLTNGAGDNSYRYAGASESVNNFVCFGSTASPCPTDNLYRIIGVFGDQVKLIKYDYANSNLLGKDWDYSSDTYSKSGYSTYKGELTTINRYYWNESTQNNTWSESNLNKEILNKNFINNFESEWADKIATTTWKVGGNTWENIADVTPSVVYQNEIKNAVTTNTTDGATENSAKIGLMYVSDYGFAAEPSAWTLSMSSYNNTTATSTNWMYMGLYEWTISRNAGNWGNVFFVKYDGRVDNFYVSFHREDNGSCVRPSFNLSSSITYVSGSGSANDPIVIN